MTKNKTIYVAIRMNELEVSKLDYIRQPGETRSAAIRRLISDEWVDANMAFDAENRFNVTDYLPPNI
jgi:hypothetical protein